jgi:hypothetical protein
MRWRVAFVAFVCLSLLWARAALPQSNLLGGGVFGDVKVAGSSYTGPLDINTTNVVASWGLRCPKATYSGNLFLVTDSATGNTTASLAQCSGGTVSFSGGTACSGPGVPANTCSPLATTCVTACNLYELFDTSAQTNCTTACNAIQATNANRPTFTQSGCPGLSGGAHTWCATGSGAALTTMNTPVFSPGTSAQPFTSYCVAYWPSAGAAGSNQGCISQDSTWIQFLTSSAGNWAVYAGTQVNTTGSAFGTWYAWQALFNAGSSTMYINGSQTALATPGTGGITNGKAFFLMQDGFGDNSHVVFLEGGVWSTDKSANYSSLNSNIRGTANGWGF